MINPFTGSYSAIDLSLCDQSICMDFSWKVLADTCGSDHLPIVLWNSEHNDKNPLRWKLSGANWEEFKIPNSEQLVEEKRIKGLKYFTKILNSIAKNAIQNIQRQKYATKIGSLVNINKAIRLRRAALKEFGKQPTTSNFL